MNGEAAYRQMLGRRVVKVTIPTDYPDLRDPEDGSATVVLGLDDGGEIVLAACGCCDGIHASVGLEKNYADGKIEYT
jgi:hypothetical protein